MSNVSTRFTSALSNLKSKDDRKRRRAIRELFEIDDEKHLSALFHCSTTKIYGIVVRQWMHLKWPRQEVSSLEPLMSSKH